MGQLDPHRTHRCAIAHTSMGYKVEFCYRLRNRTCVPDGTHCQEMDDGYGPRPIKCWTEVMCNHHPLYLSRLCSADLGSPIDLFIFSWKDATVKKLPNLLPEISASQSFGLLHRHNEYVVANLQMKFNQESGHMEVVLHRFWRSSSSWSTNTFRLPRLPENCMRKWQTQEVIPCGNDLKWVDRRQGITLHCKNPWNPERRPWFEIYWK